MDLQLLISQAVNKYLLEQGYSEEEITCKFGDVAFCDETNRFVDWVNERAGE